MIYYCLLLLILGITLKKQGNAIVSKENVLFQQRKTTISECSNALAKGVNGHIVMQSALLDEVMTLRGDFVICHNLNYKTSHLVKFRLQISLRPLFQY